MKRDFKEFTSGDMMVSMKVQVFYLILLWLLSMLQIALCWLNVFDFGLWYLVCGAASLLARVLGQFLMMV